MLKVGLTGGVASGKSTVASYLAARGAKLLDSDRLAHQVMKKGSAPWKKLKKEFGEKILTKSGQIDRKKMAEVVFKQPRQLRKLERIVHPPVIKEIGLWLKRCSKNKKTRAAVVEVPLLFEARCEKLFDLVLAVTSPKEAQVKRCLKNGYSSRKEVLARMGAQMSQAEKARRADAVIRNNGTKKELEKKVNRFWKKFVETK